MKIKCSNKAAMMGVYWAEKREMRNVSRLLYGREKVGEKVSRSLSSSSPDFQEGFNNSKGEDKIR